MEINLSRYWSTLGEVKCSVTLYFRGVIPSPSSLVVIGGQRVSDIIRLEARLMTVELSPAAKLDKWRAVVKPTSTGKILPLGERDIYPDGSVIYQLILEYEFDNIEAGDVTPRWPGLNGILYESDYTNQFFLLYDSRKKLLGSGDAWPPAIKVGKGKHTVRLQVRHETVGALEGLADMPMHLERGLKSAVSLSFYKTQCQALSNGAKFPTRALLQGTFASCYIREPSVDQLPKGAQPGDVLMGSVTYLKKANGARGQGARPGGFPVQYVVGDVKLGTATSSSQQDSSATTKLEGLASAVREAKLKYLKGLNNESFLEIYRLMIEEYPDYLPLHQALLAYHLKNMNTVSVSGLHRDFASLTTAREKYGIVITTADNIISRVDKQAIATELGTNADKDDAKAMAIRKDMEGKKAALVEALAGKVMAYLGIINIDKIAMKSLHSDTGKGEDKHLAEDLSTVGEGNSVQDVSVEEGKDNSSIVVVSEDKSQSDNTSTPMVLFENTYKELCRWEDINADKYWLIVVGRHKLAER